MMVRVHCWLIAEEEEIWLAEQEGEADNEMITNNTATKYRSLFLNSRPPESEIFSIHGHVYLSLESG